MVLVVVLVVLVVAVYVVVKVVATPLLRLLGRQPAGPPKLPPGPPKAPPEPTEGLLTKGVVTTEKGFYRIRKPLLWGWYTLKGKEGKFNPYTAKAGGTSTP